MKFMVLVFNHLIVLITLWKDPRNFHENDQRSVWKLRPAQMRRLAPFRRFHARLPVQQRGQGLVPVRKGLCPIVGHLHVQPGPQPGPTHRPKRWRLGSVHGNTRGCVPRWMQYAHRQHPFYQKLRHRLLRTTRRRDPASSPLLLHFSMQKPSARWWGNNVWLVAEIRSFLWWGTTVRRKSDVERMCERMCGHKPMVKKKML